MTEFFRLIMTKWLSVEGKYRYFLCIFYFFFSTSCYLNPILQSQLNGNSNNEIISQLIFLLGLNTSPTPATNSFTIGGTVTGLLGSGLILQNNSTDDLTISSDGSFTFSSALESGNNYMVTVFANPSSPSQICSVSNASGLLLLRILPI